MATATASRPKPKTTKHAGTSRAAYQRASTLLKQISDPTRLQVMTMLAEGEMHVGAMCDVLGQSQPCVSHHLCLLRHGGLIVPERRGKENHYSLTDAGRELAKVARVLVEG